MTSEDKHELEEKQKDEFRDLVQLQTNVKRQPDLYINETVKAVNTFKEEYQKLVQNPAQKNEKFIQYCSFLAHVNDLFKKDLEFFQNFLQDLLANYAQILNPHTRFKVCQALILICNKHLVPPIKALGLFFKLLVLKDKELRKLIINHIINDIRRRNAKHKNIAINKQVQNYVYDILKKNEDNLAKRALFIIIELYRKQVWNDDKTVNVIASGCFNKNPKVVKLACDFLIETTEVTHVEDDSSDDDGKDISQMREVKASKKTKAKMARKERELKKLKRRQLRKSKTAIMKNFFPIDMIHNPQDFCDRMFNELRKKHFKFEITLSMMSVLSRMIGRHKLLVLNFYSFIKEYLNPHQKELPRILGYFAESCHELVPPDELHPALKHLVDNFVTERMNDEKITMGLNTIREMCMKAPLVMDEDSLNYLAEMKSYKERNVAAAARALINYYRDVNPELLSKKHRGRFDMLDKKTDRKVLGYGQLQVYERVDGAQYLSNSSGIPIECDKILDDNDFKRIKVMKRRMLESKIENSEARNMLDITDKNREVGDNSIDLEDQEDGDFEEGDDEDIEISDEVLDDEEDNDMEEEVEDEDEEWEDEDDEEEGEEDEEGDKKEKKAKKGNKTAKSSTAVSAGTKTEIGNGEIDMEGISDEIEDYESSEDENPHNFVNANSIARFKKTKKLRKQEEIEQNKKKIKEKRKHTPKQKGGGTTNAEKNKHKPLMMLRPKKNKEKNGLTSLKERIKNLKNKIGHVQSGKEFKRKAKAKHIRQPTA